MSKVIGKLLGEKSKQKLLFVPNADSNPKEEHEISDTAVFRFILDEETLTNDNEEQSEKLTDQTDIIRMLKALSGIDKHSTITKFEAHRSSIDKVKDLIKVFHVFIVFQTRSQNDGDYWWSFEKDTEYIVLQRSRDKDAVRNKMKGKKRKRVRPIIENLKGKNKMKDLFAIIWAYQIIEERYHIKKSNCQSLVTFLSERITEIGYKYKGKYDYSPPETDRNIEMLDLINVMTDIFFFKHPIISLIQHGDFDIFDQVMESGDYDINALTPEGLTPLHLAIYSSKSKMVRHLLNKWKVDPIQGGKTGINALQFALMFKSTDSIDIINLLLEHEKVSINERDKIDGSTALHWAVCLSNATAVKHLLDKGANPNIFARDGQSPLHVAANIGMNIEIIDLILDAKKAKQNNEGIDDVDDKYGITALHWAAKSSNEMTAEHLIKKGANVNYRDITGRTPLHYAAEFANGMKVVDLLLNKMKEQDVDQYKYDKEIFTCAKLNQHGFKQRIITRLREKGIVGIGEDPADADKSDITCTSHEETEINNQSIDRVKIFQTTPENLQDNLSKNLSDEEIFQLLLNEAIVNSDVKKVVGAIKKILDISRVTWKGGINALHAASYYAKTTELIDAILETGRFHINEGDDDGQTPLHYAIQGTNPTTNARHLIEKKGADPTVRDKNGTTPIHVAAAICEDIEVLNLILSTKKKFDINEKNNDGWTALHFAYTNFNSNTFFYLLKKEVNPDPVKKYFSTLRHFSTLNANGMGFLELLLSDQEDVHIDPLNKNGINALWLAKLNLHGRDEKLNSVSRKQIFQFVKLWDFWQKYNSENLSPKYFPTDEDTYEDKIKKTLRMQLNAAIFRSSHEEVRDLIEKGQDISTVTWEKGINALHLASYYAKTTDLIDLIVKTEKFDINGGDNDGRTPLHYAIDGTNPTVNARHLIEEKGAKLNVANIYGFNPLHSAAMKGMDLGLIDHILETKQVDIDSRDKLGWTALHFAIASEHVPIVCHLLHKGADPTIRGKDGLTPLMMAATKQDKRFDNILDLLLASEKVDINERDDSGRTALHYAIMNSNVTTTHFLLKNEANPNVADKFGKTPLHFAVDVMNLGLIDLLLGTNQVDIDSRDKDGWTALHSAIANNNVPIFRHLLEKGANPTIRNKNGITPLIAAAVSKKDVGEILDSLLADEKVDINERYYNGWTALHFAMLNSNVTTALYLIGKGANPNVADEKGCTPLHLAAMFGKDLRIIGRLLETKRVDIDSRDKIGRTALHYAIADEFVSIVCRLLEKGANPTIRDKDGLTPLMLAATKQDKRFVNILDLLLASEKVYINKGDKSGLTALHYAIKNSNVTTARYLIEKGADPNVADENGRTPLHFAVDVLNLGLIDLILGTNQVDIDSRDKDGWTALHSAIANNNVPIVSHLLEKGANPTIRDKDGLTPLMLAATKQDKLFDNILDLLSAGEKLINERDDSGLTALHYAIMNSNVPTARYLIEKGADPNVTDKFRLTPLHFAVVSQNGHHRITTESRRRHKLFGQVWTKSATLRKEQ